MKQLEGHEFVEEMNKLGYDIKGGDDFIKTNLAVIVEMAKRIQELENKLRDNKFIY